ncbi:MAG: leucine-rich repeat domain-containing protein [Gammaproteobacteria bacterium]|nr:leucine-rich repeat domain-containing protein [Gammaproteobacteria bacterium]
MKIIKKLMTLLLLSLFVVVLVACGDIMRISTETPNENTTTAQVGKAPVFDGLYISNTSPLGSQSSANSQKNSGALVLSEEEPANPVEEPTEQEPAEEPANPVEEPTEEDPVEPSEPTEQEPTEEPGEGEVEEPTEEPTEQEPVDEPTEDNPGNNKDGDKDNNKDKDKEEYDKNHKHDSDIEVPEDEMANDNVEDIDAEKNVLPTIQVTPSEEQTQFYAEVNSDVFISVSLINPESYAILRFKLNGDIYQSYQFEEGSTSTLLVLKVNSGSVPGIKEFTIDEIKYIEDGSNEIKDVVMSGEQTVKLSVAYNNVPEVSVLNESMENDKYFVTLGVNDPSSLINFDNGDCKIYLYDGIEVLDTKTLVSGRNEIKFEGLEFGKSYQYLVAAAYDRMDEDGYSIHSLLVNDFNLSSYCKLSNISSTYDSISFDYRLLNNAATIKNIILFDEDKYPVDEWLSSDKEFKYLSSNTTYYIRLYYSLLIEGEEAVYYDQFKVTTKAHATPSITATYSVKDGSLEFRASVDDEFNLIKSKSIKLYTQSGDFVANASFDDTEITGLKRNANYVLKFIYTYDLNDGKGEVDGESLIAFSTSKAIPVVEVKPFNVTNSMIEFDTIVTDPNHVGDITSIRLYKAENKALVGNLNNLSLRAFSGLVHNTEYIVEIGYGYDLDDGNGSQIVTYEKRVFTAKEKPSVIVKTSASKDSVEVSFTESDVDMAGEVTKVEIYDGSTLYKTVEESKDLYTIDGLLSGKEYRLVVTYTYDLNDGKGEFNETIESAFNTLEKVAPTLSINSSHVTYSSFDYDILINDPDDICEIKSVIVKLGTEIVKTLESFEASSLSDLYSNNKYIFNILYSYDLNDGNGVQEKEANLEVSTLKRDDIVYEYVNMFAGVSSIDFEYKINDKDNLSTIKSIEVFDNTGALVKSLEDLTLRKIEGLAETAFYTIKTTYTYDLNDGKGAQEDSVSVLYGTSGSAIYINSLDVINNETPSVGDEVQVRLSIDNPNNLKVTAIYISEQRCEILNNSNDLSDVIIKFIPETEGGYFDVEVTGYEYLANNVPLSEKLTTNYKEQIIVMGEVKVGDYYAVSDTKYGNYGTAYLRILEIENKAGYEIKSIEYASDIYSSTKQYYNTTNFEYIDDTHILIREEACSYSDYGECDLVLSGITFGLGDVERTQKFELKSCPMTKYNNTIHISTVEDLINIGTQEWTYNLYILDNDLDLKGTKWNGIKARGAFNGNGHTIKNLTIVVENESNDVQYYGLFKEFEGIVYDLELENIYISINTPGTAVVGPISAFKTKAYGCMVNGTIHVNANDGFIVATAVSLSYLNFYNGGFDGQSYNGLCHDNYISDLVIEKSANVKAFFANYSNKYRDRFIEITAQNGEMTMSYGDMNTIVVGNSYIKDISEDNNGKISYTAYLNDKNDLAKIYVNKELVNTTYRIVTNCDSIDDEEISGLSVNSIKIVRPGYTVKWYDNENLEGDPVIFPYISADKTTLYAKWERTLLANPNYTYQYNNWWWSENEHIEGYTITSFGSEIDSNFYQIGGYYNGLPVLSVNYEAFKDFVQDSDGNWYNDEQIYNTLKDKVIYVGSTLNSRVGNSIYGNNFYFDTKVDGLGIYINWSDPNSKAFINCSSESIKNYYQNRYGDSERYLYNVLDLEDSPVYNLLNFEKIDESSAHMEVKYVDANDLLVSIRNVASDKEYELLFDEKDSEVKYLSFGDVKFAFIGSKVYPNIDKVVKTDEYRFIVFKDQTTILDKIISDEINSIDLNELGYNIVKLSDEVLNRISTFDNIVLNENIGTIRINWTEYENVDRLVTTDKYRFIVFKDQTTILDRIISDEINSIDLNELGYNIVKLSSEVLNRISSFDNIVLNENIGTIRINWTEYKNVDRVISDETFKYVVYKDNTASILSLIKKSLTTVDLNELDYQIVEIANSAFQNSKIKTITLNNGLKRIGNFAFSNSNITSIEMPSTVESLGESAFSNCTNLKNVLMSDLIKVIPTSAFNYCYSLKNIHISSSLEIIESCAFSNCYNSSIEFILPNGVKRIENNAFNGCNNSLFYIPSSVEYIGDYVFSCNNSTIIFEQKESSKDWDEGWERNMYSVNIVWNAKEYVKDPNAYDYIVNNDNEIIILGYNGNETIIDLAFEGYTIAEIGNNVFQNSKLSSITLHEGLKTIGNNAFNNCDKLKSIVLPSTVTKLGQSVFNDCNYLESVVLSDNIEEIPDHAFQSCFKLNTVNIPNSLIKIGNYAFAYCNSIEEIKLIDSVSYVGNGAFQGLNNSYIYIPQSVDEIKNDVFWDSYNITVMFEANSENDNWDDGWDNNFRGQFIWDVKEYHKDPSGFDYIVNNENEVVIVKYNGNGTEIDLAIDGYTIVEIGNKVFENTKVTSITLHEGLKIIGEYSFSNCSKLSSILIPSSVTKIGSYAFNGFTDTLFIPDTVEILGDYVFNGVYTTIMFEAGEEYVGWSENWNGCFFGQFIWNVKEYHNSVDGFEYIINNNNEISVIKYNGTEKEIDLAIDGYTIVEIGNNAFENTKVTSITLHDGLKKIGNYAFSNSRLSSINFIDGLEYIGNYAFQNTRLTSITIPNSVTYLGESSFNNCSMLKTVVLGDSIREIKPNAFSNNNRLESVTLPANLEKIGASAFNNTSLTEISLPDSLIYIGECSFINNSITNVILGNKVDTIYDSSFNSDVTIFSKASKPGSNWGENVEARTFFDYAGSDENNLFTYAYNSKGEAYLLKLKEGLEVFTLDLSLEDYVVTHIGNGFATTDNYRIRYINIPNTVKYIGRYAFERLYNIYQIEIPSSVEVLDYSVYNYWNSTVGFTKLESDPEGWNQDMSRYIVFGVTEASSLDGLNYIKTSDAVYFTGRTEDTYKQYCDISTINAENVYTTRYNDNFNILIVGTNYKGYYNASNNGNSVSGTIFYKGTYEDAQNNNVKKSNYTFYYYSETEPTDDTYRYWHYDEFNNPVYW